MIVTRGADAVRTLRERTTDLRRIDADGFRAWLGRQLSGWRRDAVFARREKIRDLRRARPELRALERKRRRAEAADADTPLGARLREVEAELRGVEQAIAGLTGALAGAEHARRATMCAKLDRFQSRRATLRAVRDELAVASPARTLLLRLDEELRALRRESGLDAEEARLHELLRAQGQRSGRSGGGFEETARRVVRAHLLPELGDGLAVLTGVTLGAARTELDQVVVRRAGDAPVEVLVVVEAKRNPNDVGHGFSRRRENLGWLAGDRAAYDPALHVTRSFPAGHFDRAVEHEQEGERFVLDPTSFRRFRTGHVVDGLYFVTRPAPLLGLSGGAIGRLRHRAATDERFDAADGGYVEGLLAWCRALAEPVETPDVLELYAADAERARRVLLVEVD